MCFPVSFSWQRCPRTSFDTDWHKSLEEVKVTIIIMIFMTFIAMGVDYYKRYREHQKFQQELLIIQELANTGSTPEPEKKKPVATFGGMKKGFLL